MALVQFDGANSLVLINHGVTELDAQIDLYSDWKEFAVSGSNLRYSAAFRTVGGDPLRPGRDLGDSYFLTNGWLIRPHAADHEVLIQGNLFAEAGQVLFTNPTGTFTIRTIVERAIDTFRDTIVVSGAVAGLTSLQQQKLDELHGVHGLATGTPMEVSDTARTFGAVVQTIEEDVPVPGTVRITRQ